MTEVVVGGRAAAVWAPAGPTPAGGWPLVLFLPGTGGTAAWVAADTRWPEAAESEGFVLAVPEGTRPDPGKPPKFLTNPPRWNDGAPHHAAGADDVGYLAELVRALTDRPAFVSGFSNGAGMAFRFAAERSELVTAVAPVAGYCWTDATPGRSVPTLYMVGDRDPLVPLAGGPVRLPWGGLVERPSVADTLAKWERLNGEAARAEVLAGLGHHWPGGDGLMGEKLGGPAGGPDGVGAVWEFFRTVSE